MSDTSNEFGLRELPPPVTVAEKLASANFDTSGASSIDHEKAHRFASDNTYSNLARCYLDLTQQHEGAKRRIGALEQQRDTLEKDSAADADAMRFGILALEIGAIHAKDQDQRIKRLNEQLVLLSKRNTELQATVNEQRTTITSLHASLDSLEAELADVTEAAEMEEDDEIETGI